MSIRRCIFGKREYRKLMKLLLNFGERHERVLAEYRFDLYRVIALEEFMLRIDTSEISIRKIHAEYSRAIDQPFSFLRFFKAIKILGYSFKISH